MSSQYNLQLKATLDTSQVQQELQRLKQLQDSYSTQSYGSSGGASAAANVANLDFRRLTQSIQSLDRQMAQLYKSMSKTAASVNSSLKSNGVQGGSGTMPIGIGKYSKASVSKQELYKAWLGSKDYKNVVKTFNQAVAESLSKTEMAALHARFGSSKSWVHNAIRSGELGGDFNEASYNRRLNEWYANQRIVEQSKMRRNQARFVRGMGSLIGGQVFGEIGGAMSGATNPYIASTGQGLETAGKALTAAGGATMTATMLGAGAAAGPIGIAAGLTTVITSVASDIQQFAEEVKKATEALSKHNEVLKEQSHTIDVSKEHAGHQRTADEFIDTNNLEGAKAKAAEWKKKFNAARDSYLSTKDVRKGEAVINEIAYQRNMRLDKAYYGAGVFGALGTLNPWSGSIWKSSKNDIEKWRQEQIEKLHKNYAKREQAMKEAKANYDTYDNAADKLQREKEKEDRDKEAERKQKEAEEERKRIKAELEQKRRESLLYSNDMAIAGYKAQGQANATQAFANTVINDKTIGPLEKFQRIAEALDKARADKNSALGKAFDIAAYIDQNKGTMTSDQIATKQKEQAKWDAQAQFAGQRVGILESELSNIKTQQLAPDLSHVTSLAQYGFNMGEKDNTIERMDKYYTRSLNLQEQIKNKLQEGVKTEATYSE